MARYDPTYLASLSRDMARGDADACAAFFAASYPEAVATASKKLKDEYAVQDVIEALYVEIFSHTSAIRGGRALMIAFRARLNTLCAERKKQLEKQTERVPLARGRGVNNAESQELLLHHIFRRLGREPSHLPLSAFSAYNEFRVSRFTLQYGLIIVGLALALLIPLLFSAPKLTLEANTEDPWAPTYTLVCDSLLPPDEVKATVNGNAVTVSLQQDGSYIITPTQAGTLVVQVTLPTQVSSSVETMVEQVDFTLPKVVTATVDSEHLTVVLEDSDSGLDLANAYAIVPDGSRVSPESWDNGSGTVIFYRLEDGSNIYFPDIAGNVLHVICNYES